MKLSYNMHEAINLRGKTIEEAGMFDIQYMHPNVAKQVINFRTSMEISSNQHYGWDLPLWVEVCGAASRPKSREDWYKSYRGWRCYMNQARANEQISL